MPAPNPSNRERLLRLIDGGTEALKEMQTDEPLVKPAISAASPAAVNPVAAPPAGKTFFAEWKTKLPALSGSELIRFGKWLVVLAALLAALHYGLEMMKTMKQPVKAAASSSASTPAAQEDESGVGLRLVGVDSSDASPVALLEDLVTGKTYFARVNEKVKDARVKQIQKNKVTLSYRGKSVELR